MSSVECTYCGLPCPGGIAASDDTPQYCCYGCRLAARIIADAGSSGGSLTRARTLLGVAIFLSMNVMVVGWMTYGQEYYAGDQPAEGLSATTLSLFRYVAMFFTAPVLLILGWPIAEAGWQNLRRGLVTTELLIALGATAAFVFSYIAVLRGTGAPYFDTVCMILVLVTAGKYLEASARVRTTSALHALEKLLPERVTILRDGVRVELALAEVTAGTLVCVQPGARIPVDGRVSSGTTTADEQIITGESSPVRKQTGDRVYAGALNGDGALVVEASAVGAGTVLHEVIDLLTTARRSKGRYEKLADRITAVFVPLVLAIALFAAYHALQNAGIEAAIMRFLAVLLISCPCALGLATPMAVWVALGNAAQHGMLFRSADALEQLAGVRTVCFDKTGTLTTGSAVVTNFIADPMESRDALLAAAAGLAQDSTHPLSRAVVRHAGERGIQPDHFADVQSSPGLGMQSAGILLGSPTYLRVRDWQPSPALAAHIESLAARGAPLTCVTAEGIGDGVFAFSEDLRPAARATVAELRRRGIDVCVLTGDHRARGENLEKQLGLRVHAELLPADKLKQIESYRRLAPLVAMVGDGINDAPALAAADVGVAMACGADVTRETADLTLASDDPADLLQALDLSRRTLRVIRQNLFWAFIYNVVGIALAATGRLSPVFAALAMVASSVLVVSNSLRLRSREGGPRRQEQPAGVAVSPAH